MKTARTFILSATDFSSHARAATTVAAGLARRRAETLRLVHVSDTTDAGARAAAGPRLEAEAQRLRQTGADVETKLLEGFFPATALLDCIRDEPPALVVVASGSKGPIDRWALGSFSEQIAEASPVPTLVVRNPAAFEAWDWTKERLAVLLALDLQATSDAVLRWARQFRMAGPCNLVAGYANHRLLTLDDPAPGPGGPVNPPAVQRRLEQALRKKVRDVIGDDAATVVVKPHLVGAGPTLVGMAADAKAQLVAVGTHQRHGLSRLVQFSLSRELLHQPALNVVCVPVTAKFDPREAHIPEYRRVLVATDFSELGNAAIPFACAACSIGGRLKIVHVARPGRRAGGAGTAELVRQLRALIPNEAGARCQPPEVEVLESRDVADALCAEAGRFGADLVCLASHGLGVSRALHGSVAKGMLKQIRRPLLVIRRPDE